MQKYYELIRRYQQPQFKYNQPLGATTPMANQNLMENYADIMKRLNELYSAKYGPNRYDISRGWAGQTASPLPGWSDLQEQQALGTYGKLATDLSNVEAGLNAYNLLMQGRSRGLAQADIVREQAEKYLPQLMRMQGLGGVGSSESSLVGIGNIYQRQLGDIEQATTSELQNMLQAYAQAQRESDIAYSAEQRNILQDYQNMAAAKVEGLLNTTTDPDTMETILEKYKNDLSPEMYDYFKFSIGVIKKELDEQKEGEFTEEEDKNKKTPTATTPSSGEQKKESPKELTKKEMVKMDKEFKDRIEKAIRKNQKKQIQDWLASFVEKGSSLADSLRGTRW